MGVISMFVKVTVIITEKLIIIEDTMTRHHISYDGSSHIFVIQKCSRPKAPLRIHCKKTHWHDSSNMTGDC